MRILLASTSGVGHFLPMLPFAAAARRAGHDVQVVAPTSLSAAVSRAGYPLWACDDVPAEELAGVHAQMAATPGQELALTVTRVFADLAPRAILPGMLAAIDAWKPDVIVRESAEFGSYVAGEMRSIRQVQVLVGQVGVSESAQRLAVPALAALRESVGLPADHAGERLWAAPRVSLLPASFDEPAESSPQPVHRYREVVEDAGSAPLSRWWADHDDPLVYVTFGTVSATVATAATALRTVVAALADLPVRLLVTTGDQDDPSAWSDLPPNVHVERWLPPRQVFGEAAAVVCHGGMGTLLAAITAVYQPWWCRSSPTNRTTPIGSRPSVLACGSAASTPPSMRQWCRAPCAGCCPNRPSELRHSGSPRRSHRCRPPTPCGVVCVVERPAPLRASNSPGPVQGHPVALQSPATVPRRWRSRCRRRVPGATPARAGHRGRRTGPDGLCWLIPDLR